MVKAVDAPGKGRKPAVVSQSQGLVGKKKQTPYVFLPSSIAVFY